MTTYQIGDYVHTRSGRPYVIRSMYPNPVGDLVASLAPIRPGPARKRTTAGVSSLTLIRTAQLSLAFHHATLSERVGTYSEYRRACERRLAAEWLARAEERGDDSRAALHLGTDRILELEAVAP